MVSKNFNIDEHTWRKMFGNKLKRLIHINGMKQGEFAAEVGISDATLSGYVQGLHNPSNYIVHKMAIILGCDVSKLYDIYD